MKKLMSIVAVVSLVAGTTLAQQNQAEDRPMRGKHGAMLKEIPNLTAEQEAQIKEIHAKAKEEVKPMREEVKEVRLKLVELKQAENPDEKQIHELIDKQAQIKAEMMKSRSTAEIEIRKLLTEEQKEAVDAKRKERMEMRKKRHHKQRMQKSE
jgi:Spy/CpxP family protein refolding chaperone